jgi:hypothetical protein
MFFHETTGDPQIMAIHREVQAQARVALGVILGRESGADHIAGAGDEEALEMAAEVIRAGLTGSRSGGASTRMCRASGSLRPPSTRSGSASSAFAAARGGQALVIADAHDQLALRPTRASPHLRRESGTRADRKDLIQS